MHFCLPFDRQLIKKKKYLKKKERCQQYEMTINTQQQSEAVLNYGQIIIFLLKIRKLFFDKIYYFCNELI